MFHELRMAIRAVLRRGVVAAIIILTLTLAIGGTTVIFSAVDAVLLRPLPYPASERLVVVQEANTARSETGLVAPVRLEEWNRMNSTLEGLAGSYAENLTDTTGSLPERVEVARTSPRFFAVLGTPAALGRTLTREEEVFGGPTVVILSDRLWRSRFNADRFVLGRTLTLGGTSRAIVGVMPPSFRYPSASTEAWVPAQLDAGLLDARPARLYTAVGRLKSGVTPEQAQNDLAAIQRRLGELYPTTDAGWTVTVAPLKEEQIAGVRRSLWILLGAVSLVLLAACGNIACVLLAQGTQREQEVAVRSALGAHRYQIVRQLLIEGFVLALAGSLLALVLSSWGIGLLRAAAVDLPRAVDIRMDPRLVAFALALCIATTLLFALVPALAAARDGIRERLSRTGGTSVRGRHRLQRTLVAAQVMVAVVLLVGAGLLIRSFVRLQQRPPGFDRENVLMFRVSAGWGERAPDVANRQFRTLQRLTAIPGVVAAALNSASPTGVETPLAEFKIVGRDTGEQLFTTVRSVSADYFRTMRIPLLKGSTCSDEPRVDAPARILVNRRFADRFFGSDDPIGQQIARDAPRGGQLGATIVGVVGDVLERGPMSTLEPVAYYCGLMPRRPDPQYLVRTDPSAAVSIMTIRAALQEIEPERAVYAAGALDEAWSSTLAHPRLNTVLLTSFAGMALLLAAIGLYGSLAQFATERTREIGVHIALGARPAQVLARILRIGAVTTGTGLALGIAVTLAGARVMATMVFGVPVYDPVTFIVAPLLIGAVAAFAIIVPARRAAGIDPVRALRE